MNTNDNFIFIERENTLLLIGKGKTRYGYKEILPVLSFEEALNKYGESDLIDALRIAVGQGVEHIYLMNIQYIEDYIDIVDTISQNDFSYIVLTDLYLSDDFKDPRDPELIHSYYAFLLGMIGDKNESVFVTTDKHASLYETIDDYLDDMNNILVRFKGRCSEYANLENMIFVANNLKSTKYANVLLASVLCTTDVAEYPTGTFGEAIFHIDPWDSPYDFAYFKSHTVRETTIENLLNCRSISPEKIVSINRIIKYIKRNLDFSEFKGKLFTPYQKLQISKKLYNYLQYMVGHVIHDFEIVSVEAYEGVPGTVNIWCVFKILPVNCLEVCTIEKGIELG